MNESAENTQLATIEKKIKGLFKEKTPKSVVKMRKGANGRMFPYIPIDYTLTKLDATFGIYWEFKIIEKEIGDKQVIVQGELNIKSPSGFSISRPGIGRKNIMFYQGTKDAVDIGNDFKAATSDAIKKAASMFGIAADVYYKELDRYEEIQDEVDKTEEDKKHAMSRFFAIASERGFDAERAKARIKEVYNVSHMEELSASQINGAANSLEKYYEKVEEGEEPRKFGEIQKVFAETTLSEKVADHIDKLDAEIVATPVYQGNNGKAELETKSQKTVEVVAEKEVTYYCQGKIHADGERPKTTVESPWCSKECEESYYPVGKGNGAFYKFMEKNKKQIISP